MALMAFSQAMTATLPLEPSEVAARWRKPSAMVGAIIFNTVGPTAVVITSALAMWASSASLSSAEFTPEKPGDSDVLGVLTHFMNGVGIVRVERVNERGRNVGEHKLIARVVQNHSHKPAADVSGAEMEGFHSVTFPKISRISSLVAAFFSCSTDSLRPKIFAILDSTFRWDPSAPAMPTTK